MAHAQAHRYSSSALEATDRSSIGCTLHILVAKLAEERILAMAEIMHAANISNKILFPKFPFLYLPAFETD